ncbi:CheR family methyltransferase [Novipirellula artificiosorum]|uniref:protein-glutamate O-methyltransferase n=1 Tax=Novipirellula artificiosorum TaxID=2528016 RepID=A0A5C6DDL1_9BACT|nr:CheR family methyltransferase [Novipirellula artificiosorum]TWU33306.1 Chemotaxis protein methyltransferase [Novipirellula artificiosorum]
MGLPRLSSHQFDRFRDFIYKNSGIHIDKNKVTLLSNRIRRRVNAGGFETFDTYYRFLTSADGASELAGFLDAITTNETYFFRTQKQFDWLSSDWLPEQVTRQRAGERKRQLRIWSAGCANGSEPYSIAICLAENLYRLHDWSLEVVGTDISEEMLEVARSGIFKSSAIDEVPQRQRRRYFQNPTENDLWEVRESIKQLVQFKQHNLMKPLLGPVFDCIFIRNVLIYFDRQSKQIAVNNLLNALAVGGYLVVGPSEGIYEMLGGLERVSPLIYKKVAETPRSAAAVGHRGGKP